MCIHTCQHSSFSRESPVFHTHLPPPPVLLFLPGNSPNLCGPKLVLWIITSIFYAKVVQLLDPVWKASPHTIDTIHISKHLWLQPGNLQPSCEVDFCTGKVGSGISGRHGRRRVGGDPAKKKINIGVNLTTAGWKNLISCLEAAHTFCKVCRTDFNIGHGGKNDIYYFSILNHMRYIRAAEAQKGSTYYKHTFNSFDLKHHKLKLSCYRDYRTDI